MSLMCACSQSITRPDQDNFMLQAGRSGIQPFVAALEHGLATSADSRKINATEEVLMFWLRGSSATVVVAPVPDNRCNSNGPRIPTYNDHEYRIDLVYESKSQASREAAKRVVTESAREVGQTLTPFRECGDKA
jgi:hypothetical protein